MMKKIVIMIMVSLAGLLSFAHKKDPGFLEARRNGGDARIELTGYAVDSTDHNMLIASTYY